MEFERKYKESEDDYGYRLYKNKELYGLNVDQIGDILNESFEVNKDESAHRKYFTPYIKGYDKGYERGLSESSDCNIAYNSLTPKSHVDKYKEIVKEYDVKKQSMRKERMQLSKYVRELAPALALSEDRKQFLIDNDFSINVPKYCYEPIVDLSDNKMIVHLTDFHIGYIIDNCKGNYFNYEIAIKRVKKLIDEIKKKCKLYDINHIYVANTGDMIEHLYMRKNQSQFCEFGLLEQITKCTDIITMILVSLAEVAIVEYNSLAGNHDRASGDKKESQKGDNANVVINRDIRTNMELANLKDEKLNRIIIHEYDEMQDEFFFKVNGVLHKFMHGDGKTNNASQLIKNEMSMDDMQYHLWKGHLHNFNVISENNGRYVLSGGCLSGYNDYSTNFGCSTIASQTIAIIDKDGNFEEIKDVPLNII